METDTSSSTKKNCIPPLPHQPLLYPTGVTRAVDLCAAPGSWSQVLSRKLRSPFLNVLHFYQTLRFGRKIQTLLVFSSQRRGRGGGEV